MDSGGLRSVAALTGRPLADMLAGCRALVDDADYPTVREWKDAGGTVLGYFQAFFPEELAHAAGMLPVLLCGAPVATPRAAGLLGSHGCPVLRSSLEVALDGRLPLDLFVAHPRCAAARDLATAWAANFDYPVHLMGLPRDTGTADARLREEFERLLAVIIGVVKVEVTTRDLRRSIAVFDENRRLLRELWALKRDEPWQVAVDEAQLLLAIGTLIPRESHNGLLADAVPKLARRPARAAGKLRVVLDGAFCEPPPLELLRAIGEFCYVVDDDLLIGMRWLTREVGSDAVNPLAALADAYQGRRRAPLTALDHEPAGATRLVERVRAARADAAIMVVPGKCEPVQAGRAAQAEALAAAGIACFTADYDDAVRSGERLRRELAVFAEPGRFS